MYGYVNHGEGSYTQSTPPFHVRYDDFLPYHIPILGSERISSNSIKFSSNSESHPPLHITSYAPPLQNLYKLDTKATHPPTSHDTPTPSSLPPNGKSKSSSLSSLSSPLLYALGAL